ncbi:hypothetical protein CFP65_0654 [Kitasatospora sp. MMS16-BH015]|uniref:NUDIX domain-containing protein n=1 Tax=Kitasatospora sp. MMS16-BH015 TaxID=2018025 RepID=UPI000CA0A2C5|nr:NUDIX hydrolase [Kitasatospora sp. MMS16-BH015]AUG75608.1 hypothetical protein CFP65_0654 [Kitasatospora sp. MMS16-BH015]
MASDRWLPPEEYVRTIANSTSYACLYFTDQEGRPFQLRAGYSQEPWQWPGGNMDPGETPWECAVRETREETGLVFEGEPRLLGVHFIARRPDWPRTHVGFLFDGGCLTPEQLARVELSDEHSEWRVQTVDEWAQLMAPKSFRRLHEIDRARRSGSVAYLES